jgi:hypothetical protein
MATLLEIITKNNDFKNFLTSNGKSIDTVNPPQMTLTELSNLRGKITRWNRKHPANKIVQIGFYTTLDGNKVTTHLVGLDALGRPIRGGGGVGDGPPYYR